MSVLRVFSVIPLMLVSLIVYNIIMVWAGDGDAGTFELFNGPLWDPITLVSGAKWTFTLGHLMIILSLFFLFFEVIKATNTGAAGMTDHALSTIVFIVFLVEFLMVKNAGTSTFFIMMIIALIDVIAGFMISISVARRDMTMAPGMGHH